MLFSICLSVRMSVFLCMVTKQILQMDDIWMMDDVILQADIDVVENVFDIIVILN